jgi:hypothetical protein
MPSWPIGSAITSTAPASVAPPLSWPTLWPPCCGAWRGNDLYDLCRFERQIFSDPFCVSFCFFVSLFLLCFFCVSLFLVDSFPFVRFCMFENLWKVVLKNGLCSENGLISDSPKLTYMAIFFKTTSPHLF